MFEECYNWMFCTVLICIVVLLNILRRHCWFCTFFIYPLLLHWSLRSVYSIVIWRYSFIRFENTVVFLFDSVLQCVFDSIWIVHIFDSFCCNLPTEHDDNCACSTVSMRLASASTQLRLCSKQDSVPLHMQGMHHFSLGSVFRMPGASRNCWRSGGGKVGTEKTNPFSEPEIQKWRPAGDCSITGCPAMGGQQATNRFKFWAPVKDTLKLDGYNTVHSARSRRTACCYS